MRIIADSSPLISLAILKRLDLLTDLDTEIYIPQAVFNEISRPNKPYSQVLTAFCKDRVRTVKNQMAVAMLTSDVDVGEAEAIVLALEMGVTDILIDDAKGRRAAKLKGLQVIGTIGILLVAKQRGLIMLIQPELDALLAHNIHIGHRLYEQALILADEALSS